MVKRLTRENEAEFWEDVERVNTQIAFLLGANVIALLALVVVLMVRLALG